MADTDPPAGTPDPVVVTDENLLLCLHWCLTTLVARFTMRPVHYEEYVNEIVRNFDALNIPYGEFRFQMAAILQLLDWCQEWEARIVMGSEDYDCYARLKYDQCHALVPHDTFMEEMGALLQSPYYHFLRLWWHIHRMDVCGVRRMVDNPFLRFPLALWVTLHIVLYFAMFGDTLWNLFLNTVRRHLR